MAAVMWKFWQPLTRRARALLRAVIFDFGDTLAYLWAPKLVRFAWLCRQAGIPLPSRRTHAGAVAFERVFSAGTTAGPSLGWRGSLEAFRAGLAAAGVPDPDTASDRLWRTAAALPSHVHANPDAPQLLADLRARGLRLAVLSNHVGKLRENLREIGLDGPWDAMLDSALIGLRKPDPAAFHLACEQLCVDPAEAVNMGDEPPADAVGATGAGLKAVLLDPLGAYGAGYPLPPCARVAGLQEARRVLLELSAPGSP